MFGGARLWHSDGSHPWPRKDVEIGSSLAAIAIMIKIGGSCLINTGR